MRGRAPVSRNVTRDITNRGEISMIGHCDVVVRNNGMHRVTLRDGPVVDIYLNPIPK